MSYPAYPEYKDSGVEWLGEVPVHWEVKRLKHLLIQITDRANRRSNPIALENIESWSGCYIETESDFSGEGIAFQAGDLLFGKLRPYLAKVYLSKLPGEALGDFHVIRPSAKLVPEFAFHQLLQSQFISVVDGATHGAKMPRVGWEVMGNMPFINPPTTEQKAIATFLDHETARIDALVEEQQRLIALLKEKRQAVISHAVTKGLDPDVPMKDSGVEWLGEVPAHWDILRIGTVYVEAAEKGLPELPVLRVSIHHGVSDRELNEEESDRKVTRIEDREKYKRVRHGDLVYNMMRAWQGGFGAVLVDGLVSPAYVVARPKLDDVSEFIEQLLRTANAVEEMRSRSYGITDFRLRLYWENFKNIKIALPPREERQEIINWLQKIIIKSRALESEAGKNIGFLEERRSALISAAVTGKIDVRGWQPSESSTTQESSQQEAV
ncbi:restriction endonuclease subunit S [Halomonas sp. BLK-85]